MNEGPSGFVLRTGEDYGVVLFVSEKEIIPPHSSTTAVIQSHWSTCTSTVTGSGTAYHCVKRIYPTKIALWSCY